MSERRKTQGEYLALTLELLTALENRDMDKAYLLRMKRKIFDIDAREQDFSLRKMEEHIFNNLTYKAPSWIEALISYKELFEGTSRPESLGFLWRGTSAFLK